MDTGKFGINKQHWSIHPTPSSSDTVGLCIIYIKIIYPADDVDFLHLLLLLSLRADLADDGHRQFAAAAAAEKDSLQRHDPR